jgi:2-oxoglutarate ferredoxin oxidoreductase subunit beta
MKDGYELIYIKPDTLVDVRNNYCPGCFHSTIHKLMMEVIGEMDIQEKVVGVCPVGCSVFAYDYMNVDIQEAAHGRAAAVATGIKRILPDRLVFSYQGDGDLAAIGIAETLHACNRGEKFTFIFINNGIYGMTGGQMAPTTLEGQVTTTSPFGRDINNAGMPMKMAEIIAGFDNVCYVERVSCNTPANARKAKKAIRKAFDYQMQELGTTFIEVASNCPSNWKCTPEESLKWLEERVFPYYPLKVFKEPGK